MESRNPVFNNGKEFRRGGSATFGPRTPSVGELNDLYTAPAATSAQTGRMTLDDVVVRTAALFAVLLATAGLTYFVLKPGPGIVLGSALIGFGLAMLSSFGRPKPAAMIAYAAVEGVFVGGVSLFYETAWNGIVPQAVLGTLT